jgi:N-acetylated-alpha-linked acidic dipeptidase
MLHRWTAAVLTACLTASIASTARAGDGRPGNAALERFLVDIPTSAGTLEDSAEIEREAHYPGSSGDKKLAMWMRDRLASYGFQAGIEPVYAQVPVLKRAVLQLLVHPSVDFDLRETPIAQDPDASRGDAGIPFNAWSGSGQVTAPLVYANRGLPTDYATLQRAGVGVRGKIVLIRYGAGFRGELAQRAMEHGAAAVILYSDPADRDGSAHGLPYPDGPYRPLGSVQRGSVGPPLLKIPVLPVSALTARRLLQDVAGAPPPAGWRGALGAPYALGQTRADVHLRVDQSDNWIWIWNTIAVLPGTDGSHSVILGGHRDAWVYGVTDNGSGISTILEAARALGYIYRAGWRPRYNIVIAGWDGEEIGEAGSNSFVRTHFWQLRHGCIAYVNADETATGSTFYTTAAAALAKTAAPVTRMVPSPGDPAVSVWDRWRSQAGGVRVFPPGGGSDHDPFLSLLGIPVIQMGFAGPFGVYHSAFDDLRYATTQADPGFTHHRALAQMLALLLFRMTSGPLPYDFNAYVAVMRNALRELRSHNGAGASLRPVSQAIDRFAAAAKAPKVRMQDAIRAVRKLDTLLYGRDGYTAIFFPRLSAALDRGDAAAVASASAATAADIDAVSARLQSR